MTGWGFKDIMEGLPIAAGLQIIDADLYAKGIQRVYVKDRHKSSFDSRGLIDETFQKLGLK